MKKTFILGLAGILLIALLAPVIQAETKITFDGQVRVREMFDKTSFDTSAVFDHFVEMRSRVGVKATVDDNTTAYVQIQDSRVFGATDQFGNFQSGSLNDGKNVDIHQAYISIDNLFGKRFGAKMGRFEFNRGNQRVFGAVGWSNVARAWEGGMYWYNHDKFKVDLVWLKSIENRDTGYDRDYDIVGLFGKCKKSNLEWFAVMELDKDTTGLNADINKLARMDLGLYYKRLFNQFDFETNVVFQGGTMSRDAATEYDIAAMLLTLEAGYNFEGDKNARVALGIDIASGNDPTETDSLKWTAYNNMYYTGHKFRGYMDYFLGSNSSGLVDFMLRGKFDPIPGWTVKGDLHLFSTAEDYADPTSTTTPPAMTKDVGTEIDITVSTTRVAGVKLDCGFSYFMAKDAFAGMTDSDPGLWAYSMATVNF